MTGPEHASSINFASVTARLLRRADFYEMRSIQSEPPRYIFATFANEDASEHFQSALLDSVSSEVALTPSLALGAIASKKIPKPFRLLTPAIILRHVSTFRGITSLIPVEFIGKLLRNALIDRAIGLDIWISSKGADILEAGSLVEAQTFLRRFVVMVKGDGLSIVSVYRDDEGRLLLTIDFQRNGPAIFALLVRNTVSDVQALTEVTVQLYRKLLE